MYRKVAYEYDRKMNNIENFPTLPTLNFLTLDKSARSAM